eukprot:m.201781 g.201781  ORF g.201781 m.201781 type:complete len:57 (+) comp14969_c0_seq5:941-1111(+)
MMSVAANALFLFISTYVHITAVNKPQQQLLSCVFYAHVLKVILYVHNTHSLSHNNG